MSLGFVTVTYNSERVLGACLESMPAGYDAVVVDNASKDRSAELARSLGARVIVNEKNIGFGSACNRGAELLSTSHIFFLNPDSILTESAVAEIEKAIKLFPEAGGFGAKLTVPGKRPKFRKTSYPQCQDRPSEAETAPTDIAEVDFLDGAALVCNREVFFDIGGFDERIFLYYDDDDLCYRIRSQNKKLIYVPSACVTHARNGSSGSSLSLDYLRSYHAARSRLYISSKYGLPLDPGREKRRAAALLLKSVATVNVRKATKTIGTLYALHSYPAADKKSSAVI